MLKIFLICFAVTLSAFTSFAEEQRVGDVVEAEYRPTAATRIPCEYNKNRDDGFRIICTPPGLRVSMSVDLTFHSLMRIGKYCGRKTSLNCTPECRAYLSDPEHYDCKRKEGCDRWMTPSKADKLKDVSGMCSRLILANPRGSEDEIVEDTDLPADPPMHLSVRPN